MTVTVAFFNNKGGVGKTTLAYHLAWMFAGDGLSVLSVDLDPQANLSAMFLDEDRLEQVWPEGEHPETILGSVFPILEGTGDVMSPHVEDVGDNLHLVIGDLGLSGFEDQLSTQWPKTVDRDKAAYRVISSFYRLTRDAAAEVDASITFVDVGPNLGAINRAALIGADYIVIPLAPDLFSVQGLRNLGPTLRRWRREWEDRLDRKPADLDIPLPSGRIEPLGYVTMQHGVRGNRLVKAYARWADRIPSEYRRAVLGKRGKPKTPDDECLAQLKHYRSLMPLAMDAHKPMFLLKPADGAIGAHMQAVSDCELDFRDLAQAIAARCGVAYPARS